MPPTTYYLPPFASYLQLPTRTGKTHQITKPNPLLHLRVDRIAVISGGTLSCRTHNLSLPIPNGILSQSGQLLKCFLTMF